MKVQITIILLQIFSVACIRLSTVTEDNRLQGAGNYIAELIRNESRSVGSFCDVWLQALEGKPSKTKKLIDFILPQIPDTVRMIPNNLSFPFTVTPKLIVFCVNDVFFNLLAFGWTLIHLTAFGHEPKMLIVFDRIPEKYQNAIMKIFTTAEHYNMVFVKFSPNRIRYVLKYRREVITRNELPPIDQLFVDQSADLGGHKFMISYRTGSEAKVQVNGAMWQWITALLDHLNGRYQFDGIDCDFVREDDDECFDKLRYSQSEGEYDFSLEPVTYSRLGMGDDNRVCALLYRMIVVVPRGRILEPIEMFGKPFDVAVWIAFIILLVGSVLVMRLFPNVFKNDLVLAPLCGYEECDLNQTSRMEKIVISALVVFYFFLLNAYETKILALMTSYPRIHDAHTVDDMVRMGIKVPLDLNVTYPPVNEDNELYQAVEHVPGYSYRKNRTLDGVHGYFGNEVDLKIMLSDPINYDFELDQPRYVQLRDYQFGNMIMFMRMRHRVYITERISKLEKTFMETGLMQHWQEKVFQESLGVNHEIRVSRKEDDASRHLLMAELVPAWLVLAIGYGLSTLVFVWELVNSDKGNAFRKFLRNKLKVPDKKVEGVRKELKKEFLSFN